ncbi:hypothetical protein IMG5_087900 [Ichthyophthirius multifiliis]|uniref:EF-hand domain-containing protein n=1 Tax=Ichthyophthirius multifiliis TaxID=5932 RepID=G0QR26_ICHMU|nr:hypothetical protein IMG5_087900 [Ichthyophthirius multifiliis]EGR32327.1 hypothetical protein IMG5_087900 [Ichthyophthirius multifiliis]|eukprot:XP_004035813.1 hypothetical protein IMG5_087900 [Ichthyophthirius multifiliis]
MCNNNQNIIDKNTFYDFFDAQFPLYDFKRSKTEPNSYVKSQILDKDNTNNEEDIIQKVKSLINGKNILLESKFQALDPQKTGKISILEFKNVIRSLGLNLKAKEIDQIIVICDDQKDGFINYINILQKFKQNMSSNRISQRQNIRLKKIKQNLIYYMISPIDAFRQFNTDHTGKMSFEQFYNFIQKLSQMSNEELPQFDIIKDIFLTLDTRNDGFIDQNEWINTFSTLKDEENQIIYNKTLLSQFKNNTKSNFELIYKTQNLINSDCFQNNVKDFNNLISIIGRNRKYLMQQFHKINQVITYDICVSVLKKMFNNLGIYIDDLCFNKLIKFAQREGNIIDFKFLLDVYKERFSKINIQPNISVL